MEHSQFKDNVDCMHKKIKNNLHCSPVSTVLSDSCKLISNSTKSPSEK